MKRCDTLFLIAATLLSACVTSPPRHEPSLPANASGAFTSTSITVDPAHEPPNDWWRLYDDEELAGLVAEALTANTDLLIAVANLTFARAIVQEARAGRYPATQLGAGVLYGRSLTADSIAAVLHRQAENQTTRLLGVDVSYELDLYGRVAASIKAAQADAEAVEAARDGVRVVVAAETTRAWASARSSGHELAVAQRSAEIAAEEVRIVVRQLAAGAASQFDLARVRVIAAQARAQLPVFEGRRRAARLELAALLGRLPPDLGGVTLDQTTVRLAVPLPVGDGAQLLARRPDVRQADRRLAASGARVGVATASLYPRISLGAGVGLASNEVLQGSNAVSFAIGPLLSWSFPNQAVARARIEQSGAAALAALAAFDGTVLRALKEVEQAISACDAETARRRELAEAEAQAAEAYRLSRWRRREGAASQLDVLNAEQTLLLARAAVAGADSRIVDAQVTIFKALGGGWHDGTLAASDPPPLSHRGR